MGKSAANLRATAWPCRTFERSFVIAAVDLVVGGKAVIRCPIAVHPTRERGVRLGGLHYVAVLGCLPLQPVLHARVLADSNVEPHPVNVRDGGGKPPRARACDAVALRRLRQRKRVANMGESPPRGTCRPRARTNNSQPDAFEGARDIEAGLSQALDASATDICDVVAIHQHQIGSASLGELREVVMLVSILMVGEFVGDVLLAGEVIPRAGCPTASWKSYAHKSRG